MFRKYLLPALAVIGVVFAVYSVVTGSREAVPAAPVAEPAASPYASTVAGAGIVEASTENIAIGTHVPGVVTKVFAAVGAEVKAEDPLFLVDDRDVRAQLLVRQASLKAAQAQLEKLLNSPRPEDIPPAEAKVAEARAHLDEAKRLREMWSGVEKQGVVSQEELLRRASAVDVAAAQLADAEAELARLRAGAWAPDVEIARAEVAAAAAQVKAVETELERLTVRAPVAGTVLQVKVRPGEYAQAGPTATPLMLIGDTRVLHVRVDIDENDAWRVGPDAPAVATVRGNRDLRTPLRFVRIEPYVVPKQSLTGASTERVDTRVLQLVYAFDRGQLPVYVGQQMDVSIEAQPLGASTQASAR